MLYRTLKVKIVQHTSKRRVSQRYRNEKNILFEIIKVMMIIIFLLIKGSSKISFFALSYGGEHSSLNPHMVTRIAQSQYIHATPLVV